MELKRIIRADCCALLEQSTKTEVLLELLDLLVGAGLVRDTEELKKELFYREQLMSTGIGLGLGVPHVRFDGVDGPVAAVGVQPRGIADYGSIDNEPVRIVIMIIVGRGQHKEYIRLLSLIVGRFKRPGVRERLLAARGGKEIQAVLAEEPSDG